MNKLDQVLPHGNTPKERILGLAWNIATEPRLYRLLASNPYSQPSLQIISERFPDSHTGDVIKAIALAEPEGKYDRDSRSSEILLREDAFREQRDIIKRARRRLAIYSKKHTKDLSILPKEDVYERLSWVVFETTKIKKIEQRYSQDQRRDLRLSIIACVEEPQRSRPFFSQTSLISRHRLLPLVFGVISLMCFLYFIQGMSVKPVLRKQIVSMNPPGAPVRLLIPQINVNARVQRVGMTSTGAMETPSNTVNVGWFDLGPRPGEKGSSVIAGHFDAENGEAGVFNGLYKLKQGDKLYVEDSKGTFITFIVRENRIYDPGYAEDVFSRNDNAHLNLVTCDGIWDGKKKSYSKRLVVFADIFPSENFRKNIISITPTMGDPTNLRAGLTKGIVGMNYSERN